MISEKQETERETVLEDMLKPPISISMETMMMTKRTGFQNLIGRSLMHKNKKL